MRGEAGLVLGGLFGQVDVERRLAVLGPPDDGGQLVGRDRAHRVHGRADPRVGPVGEGGRALGPALGVAVAEAQLVRFGAAPKPEER